MELIKNQLEQEIDKRWFTWIMKDEEIQKFIGVFSPSLLGAGVGVFHPFLRSTSGKMILSMFLQRLLTTFIYQLSALLPYRVLVPKSLEILEKVAQIRLDMISQSK